MNSGCLSPRLSFRLAAALSLKFTLDKIIAAFRTEAGRVIEPIYGRRRLKQPRRGNVRFLAHLAPKRPVAPGQFTPPGKRAAASRPSRPLSRTRGRLQSGHSETGGSAAEWVGSRSSTDREFTSGSR